MNLSSHRFLAFIAFSFLASCQGCFGCKTSPIDNEELLLVRGVTPEIFYGSRAARQAAKTQSGCFAALRVPK
jgi:hypothetical protein